MANITFKGNPITTIGELPSKDTVVKNFELVNDSLENKSLSDYGNKRKILNIFPSIDTGVCAAAARQFNLEAKKLDNTVVINISKDLPFALGRFCAAEGLDNVENLSDFRGTFGEDFGVTLKDGPLAGLLSRAVVVLDEENKVLYTEQVPEITQEPNYSSALNALNNQ